MQPCTLPDEVAAPVESPNRRVLYFDVDGTLVRPPFGPAKPALADGAFERAVRAVGFDRIVCVSDALLTLHLGALGDEGSDGLWRALFDLCDGTFEDEAWFQAHVDAVADPLQRALAIDRYEDWYYVDDRAQRYAARAGLQPGDHPGRILACRADGDGSDVLRWLRRLAHGDRSVRPLWRPPFDHHRYSASSSFSSTPYVWRRV